MPQFTTLKRIKVLANRLSIGMYVTELDKPWRNSSFAFQGFPIETEQQLQQLRKECQHVFVDFKTQEEYEVFLKYVPPQKEEILAPISEASLTVELHRSIAPYQQALTEIGQIKAHVAAQKLWQLSKLEAAINQIAASIARNPDAMLLAAASKHREHYQIEHCLRVAVIAMAFGQHLGMSALQVAQLGLGASLHDIGKMRLPSAILNKTDKLDREQAKTLALYPQLGYQLLSAQFGVSEVVKDIVQSHHEREDGRGYPRHIGKDRVSREAKIVGIVDAFDALASDRSYGAAKPIQAALALLIEGKNSKYDAGLISEFVSWIGTYPVGSLVEMVTGEIALVLHNRGDHKLNPCLLLISDERHRIGLQKTVDLLRSPTRHNGRPYAIHDVFTTPLPGLEIMLLLEQLARERHL